MPNAVIAGAGSEIGQGIAQHLRADGWTTHEIRRNLEWTPQPWDLALFCFGSLEPVANFFETYEATWQAAFEPNLFLPLRALRLLYPHRNSGTARVRFGGTNPFKSNPYYSAYAASKSALRMAVKDIGTEAQDLRIFMLDTGMVRTKIHEATIAAGIYNERLERTDGETSHDMIYAGLKKCLANPIGKIRGNFFFIPHIV